MQGSLDSPPLLLCFSRRKVMGGIVLAVLIAALSQASPRTGLAVPAFAAATVLILCWQLVDPVRLRLDPDGLTYSNTIRSSHWTWQDVGAFRSANGLIQCERFGLPGFCWDISANELVELLNTARARWIAPPGDGTSLLQHGAASKINAAAPLGSVSN